MNWKSDLSGLSESDSDDVFARSKTDVVCEERSDDEEKKRK